MSAAVSLYGRRCTNRTPRETQAMDRLIVSALCTTAIVAVHDCDQMDSRFCAQRSTVASRTDRCGSRTIQNEQQPHKLNPCTPVDG
jgi:hypothetical protein